MAKVYRQVGQVISKARKARAYTQAKLAKAVGCSQPALSAWEAGDSPPSEEFLDRLATELDLSPSQLRGLIDEAVTRRDVAASDLESEFTHRAIEKARKLFPNGFEIELVAPEQLPVVGNASVKQEWVTNLSSQCNYRIYWFTDFLLQNLASDQRDERQILNSFANALEDVANSPVLEKLLEQNECGRIEHLFLWSGVAYLDLTQSTIERLSVNLVRFIKRLLEISICAVYIEGYGEISSENNQPTDCMHAHISKFLNGNSINERVRSWSDIQHRSRYICGDFWSNGDSLVVYRDIDPEPIQPPLGYRRLRPSFDFYSDPNAYSSLKSKDISNSAINDFGIRWLAPLRVEMLHIHLRAIYEIVSNEGKMCAPIETASKPETVSVDD